MRVGPGAIPSWFDYRQLSGAHRRDGSEFATSPLSPGGSGVGGEGEERREMVTLSNRRTACRVAVPTTRRIGGHGPPYGIGFKFVVSTNSPNSPSL